MKSVEELAPGLWRWAVPRGGIPQTMTAYALRDAEGTVLVDPLSGRLGREPDEALLAALDEIVRGRVRIVVTTPFHVRGSDLLWRRWRDRHEVTIYGHEQCVHPERLTDRSAFQALRGGEELDGGVRVHTIGKPKRAEMPSELSSHGAIAFGDCALRKALNREPWVRPPTIWSHPRRRP